VTRRRAAGAAPPSSRLGAALGLLLAVLPAVAHAQTFEARLAACLACHGADGASRIPGTPSLGGQPAFFLITQLFLFREGRRDNEAMTAAATPLTNDDLRAFADAVAKLPPPSPPVTPPDPARFARGRAQAGRRFCGACHGADYSGREQVPRLANQREEYLLAVMRGFKAGTRIGYGPAMSEALFGLADEDLLDIAHYLAHLPRP
jgi:cytochrome c553